jgi:hypothetical protein
MRQCDLDSDYDRTRSAVESPASKLLSDRVVGAKRRLCVTTVTGLLTGLLLLGGCAKPPESPREAEEEVAHLATIVPKKALNITAFGAPGGKSINAVTLQSPTDTVIPLLMRQADCSLTLLYGDAAGARRGAATANYQNALLTGAGVAPPANPFPQGCADNRRGIAAEQVLALGQRSDGAYYGALVQDAGIVVAVASATTGLISQNTITLTTGPTETVLRLAAGDFNGDGKPDLVATIQGSTESLAVLRGNGDGTFAAPVRYTVSGLGFYVVADDFNNDNHVDLATVTVTGVDLATFQTVVTVLSGNGDGTFAAPQVVATSSGYGGGLIVSADFNGDGRRDIAVASGQIFLGQTNGAFSPVPGSPISFGGSALAAGDFDRDGRTDLAVAGDVVQIWHGTGDGHFTKPDAAYALNPVSAIRSLAAIDIDGDGKLDLVSGLASGGVIGPNDTSGVTQFLLGLGDGHFSSISAYARTNSVLADFNGDGKLDLLGFGDASTGSPGFQPMLGSGNGDFAPGPLSQVGFSPANALNSQGLTYIAVDLNSDQKLDLVAAGGTTFAARLGNGDGSFHATGTDVALPFAGGSAVRGFVTGDFNGDGKADIAGIGNVQVSNTTASGEVVVLDGKGDGTFQALRVVDNGLLNPDGIAAADFNGDGHVDLAVIALGLSFGSSPQPGNVRIYRGIGDGTFQPAQILNSTLNPRVMGVGDVNGDGRPDVVVLSVPPLSFNGTLEVYLANSNGSFTAVPSRAMPDAGSTSSIAIGDIDGDGHADLVLGGCCNSVTTAVFSGNGDGTFGAEKSVGIGPNTQAAALGDLNGDGRPDIVTEQSSGAYTDVFINRPVTKASTADFLISAANASGTVNSGQAVQTTITLTPIGGYAGTISLSCSGLPTGATCGFAPNGVAVNGSAATSTVTISTTARVVSATVGPTGLLFAGAMILGLLRSRVFKRQSIGSAWQLNAWVLLVCVGLVAGCGGGSSSSSSTSPSSSSSSASSSSSTSSSSSSAAGTPVGTSTVTITATGGAIVKSISYSLTVN